MKKTLISLIATLVLCGCGANVDENKTPQQAKAEALTLDSAALQKKVDACKKFLEEQNAKSKEVIEKMKAIPLSQQMGEDAQKLRAEAKKIGDSVKNVGDQLQVYLEELKAKAANAAQ